MKDQATKLRQAVYWKKLKSALEDDCWNFGEGWAEQVTDCPSNTISELFDRKEESGLSEDEYWNKIDELIKEIEKECDEE